MPDRVTMFAARATARERRLAYPALPPADVDAIFHQRRASCCACSGR